MSLPADVTRTAPTPDPADAVDLAVASDPRTIEPLWRAFERDAVGHVFQTFEWTIAWLESVGAARGVEPRIVVATLSEGRTACLLPFGIRTANGARTLEWLGAEHADYHAGLFDRDFLEALAERPESFEAFFRRVVGTIGDIDLAHFIRQPERLDGQPNPFLNLPCFQNANSAHAAILGTDWDAYYTAHRGSSNRRRIDRSRLKKLNEAGEVRFVTAPDEAQRREILTTLFEQKRHGLARIGAADMFAPPGVRDFYTRLAGRPWPEGPGHLCALYCGDRIVAANLGWIRGGTYYYVLHSYDLETFANLSPGRQLMYEIMQWSIANGIGRFDFTIGDEGFKDKWCDETTELFDSAVPVTLRGHTAAVSYRLLQRAKRIVKKNRHLWAMAVFMRTQLRRG